MAGNPLLQLLLATDLEMATPDGYASTSWESGYGDYVMKPDLATMRPVPWLEGTVLVLCDYLDHHHHAPVPHSPRQILQALHAPDPTTPGRERCVPVGQNQDRES